MRGRLLIPGLILVFLVILAGLLVRRYIDAGELRNISPHQPGRCRPVLGVNSSEDIVIDPSTNIAYISSGLRRPSPVQEPAPGSIFAYDLSKMPGSPTPVASDLPFEFFPHGIGLFSDPEGTRLFAVNHRSDSDSVEIFDVNADGSLVHVESIVSENLYNANDIVPTGDRTFFLTRDHGSKWTSLRRLEDIFALEWSSVIFFDGSEFRTVADRIAYANGLAIDSSQTFLYVGASTGKAIHIFRVERETGRLLPERVIPVETGVDNLSLEQDKTLWIAGHPKLLTFLRYSRDRNELSPSQVLRVRARDSSSEVEEIFLGDGKYLSASSVAVPWRDKFLIGSVFDQRFLICEMGMP